MRRPLLLLASLIIFPLLGCGSSIGDTCSVNGDCGDERVCRADFPGGYCTQGCTSEGDTASCPSDSICTAQFRSLVCMTRCKEHSDCREGYQCNGVTGTSIKSCQIQAE